MDWTNDESEHDLTPATSGAARPDETTKPSSGTERSGLTADSRAKGSIVRTGVAIVGALSVVAAIGGTGFVIGRYVNHSSPQVAFGTIPNFPNFPQLPSGASGASGSFSGGANTPATLPSHSPSAATAARIARKVDVGVVDISTTSSYQSSSAAGTGMVLSSDGLVLTNNHVINGATSIDVRVVTTGQVYSAKVLGYSVSRDVALLQLQGASGLATVTTADSGTVTNNQPIVAIGNAGGVGGTPSVAPGAVIATHQSLSASDPSNLTGVEKLTNMIQVAADIQPGDSGGPLVTTRGQVIGMDTAGSTSGSGFGFGFNDQTSANTQGYAIPINTALSIVRTIEAGRSTAAVHVGATPILGVEISPTLSGYEASRAPVHGVTIAGLAPGSPAAASGLVAGDVITAINGRTVTSPTQLSAAVQKFAPGDRVKVSFTALSGTSSSVNVSLVAGPAL